MVLVRKLVHTERSATIVLYFGRFRRCWGFVHRCRFGWVMPTLEQFAWWTAGILGEHRR